MRSVESIRQEELPEYVLVNMLRLQTDAPRLAASLTASRGGCAMAGVLASARTCRWAPYSIRVARRPVAIGVNQG